MELLICSLVTILPDFLVRRFVQGKRIGKEITIFSVWYELRWGITACAILTVALISMILFYHPSSSNVTSFFRTVTILPQTSGRVVEVKVANGQQVKAGDILFQMDASAETAAVEVARANIEEIRAQMVVSRADLDAALAQVENAEANLTEARINLNRSQELNERNQNVVAKRELERQATKVVANEALLHAAQASYREANANLTALLPAQMQVAEANLQQAQAQLAFKTVRAGVDGTVQQFVLRAGDYVSGIMRPAGILIPEGSGIGQFESGFSQVAGQVVHPDMVGEMMCFSNPCTLVPMVVTSVQPVIAAGGIRPSNQLVDVRSRAVPGTITVFMEPVYDGGADKIRPGSKCIANLYTSTKARLGQGDLSTMQKVGLTVVDGVALLQALIIRAHALIYPVRSLFAE